MNWSLVTIRQGSTTSVAVRREDGSLVAPPELKRWPTMTTGAVPARSC
jgi:hypothetical protein